MCGRYTHLFTWEELHRLSTLTSPRIELPRSFNVAPTQRAPVVRMVEGGGRAVDLLKWGLVPFWAKDEKIGNTLINARAETVAEKPAYRAAFKVRRCLVPVSGFYEWKVVPGATRKQPYYIRAAADEPLLLAGLWESWKGPRNAAGEGGEQGEAGGLFAGVGDPVQPLETFTIVTTTPNALMAEVHDRMPVIIDPSDQGKWLDPRAGVEDLKQMLVPYPAEQMMKWPVSTRVNSPRNNDEACVTQVAVSGE